MKPWYIPNLSNDKLSMNMLARHLVDSRSRILTGCRTWGFGHLLKEPYVYLARTKLYPDVYGQQRNILLKYRGWGNTFLADVLKEHFVIFEEDAMNDIIYSVSKKYKELAFSIEDSLAFDTDDDGADCRNLYKRYISRQKQVYVDLESYFEKFGADSLLPLPERYEEACRIVLDLLGIEEGRWFVVMHVAEKSSTAFNYNLERRHDFFSFKEMAEHIVASGGIVLRLGHPSIAPLQPHIPGVIDYAHWQFRSPFSDMCILWKCRYMVNVMSGPQSAAQIMGKPQIMCNWMPLMCMGVMENEIMLTHKILHKKENKLLSCHDMLSCGAGYRFFVKMNDFDDPAASLDDFELIPNSPEELCAAVDEMHALLDHGKPPRTPLQQRFRESVGPNFFYTKGEVSSSFLEKNRYLLG